MRKQREHRNTVSDVFSLWRSFIYLYECAAAGWCECKQVFVVSSVCAHVGFKFKMCIQKMHRNASPRIAWWQDLRESPFRLVFCLMVFSIQKISLQCWRAYNYKMYIVVFFISSFILSVCCLGRFIVSFCAWHAFSARAISQCCYIRTSARMHKCTNTKNHK